MWKGGQMGVGSTLGRRRGQGATWGGLLPPLTILPPAAPGHLPPGTQHCSLEMGMRRPLYTLSRGQERSETPAWESAPEALSYPE